MHGQALMAPYKLTPDGVEVLKERLAMANADFATYTAEITSSPERGAELHAVRGAYFLLATGVQIEIYRQALKAITDPGHAATQYSVALYALRQVLRRSARDPERSTSDAANKIERATLQSWAGVFSILVRDIDEDEQPFFVLRRAIDGQGMCTTLVFSDWRVRVDRAKGQPRDGQAVVDDGGRPTGGIRWAQHQTVHEDVANHVAFTLGILKEHWG